MNEPIMHFATFVLFLTLKVSHLANSHKCLCLQKDISEFMFFCDDFITLSNPSEHFMHTNEVVAFMCSQDSEIALLIKWMWSVLALSQRIQNFFYICHHVPWGHIILY